MALRIAIIGGVFIVLAGLVILAVVLMSGPQPGPEIVAKTTPSAVPAPSVAPVAPPRSIPSSTFEPRSIPPAITIQRRTPPVPRRKPPVPRRTPPPQPDPAPARITIPPPQPDPAPARITIAPPQPDPAPARITIPPPQPDPAPARITIAPPPPRNETIASLPPPRQQPRQAEQDRRPKTSRYKQWTPPDSGGRKPARAVTDDLPEKPQPRRATPETLLASVDPLLQKIPCAVLDANVVGNTVSIHGAAFNPSEIQRLRSTLMNLGDIADVRTNIHTMNKEQCRLVNLFSPYIDANRKLARRVSVRAPTASALFEEYDPLIVDLVAPDRDGYLYVDYYALDGNVVHLMPSPAVSANHMRANGKRRLGDRPENGEWIVGRPFGLEMIVAISSAQKLFAFPREEIEHSSAYLPALQAELKRAAGTGGAAAVAHILFIKTQPVR